MKDPIKAHRTDLSEEDSEALRAPPQSPVYFLIIVAISIIVAEAVVMIILSQIHPHLLLVTALIDSTLLILLLFPLLYLFLYRPQIQYINRQRQIETTLLRSEEKYRTLVNVSPVGIFHTDTGGRLTYINKEGIRIADLTPEEAYSGKERWAKSLHPEDRERVISEWNQTVKYHIDFKSEYRFQRRDGKSSWVVGHATVLKDSAGQLMGYMGTLRDITDRKKAEEKLKWESSINASLADLSRRLLSEESISIDEISCQVLEHTRRLTGSEFGYVGYIDPDTGFIISPTLTRDVWDQCNVPNKSITFEKFSGLWGWVLNNKKPLMTNTPGDDPRSFDVPKGHVPIHRFLSAPALLGEKLVGQISLANSNRDYTMSDLEFLEQMADFYAITVQRMWAEKELLAAATRERLTGLLNRFTFEKDEKNMENPVLVLIDIDGFRHVNDLYGTEAGNSVLKDLSRYLESTPPENLNVKVYKLGGDDFGILFEDNPEYHPMDLAKKIVVEGSNRDFMYEGNAISISLSAGISRERPLLEKADMVLNYLRRHTRVKYLEYNDSLTLKKNISENMKMLNILKTAINRDAIVSYFQPIVNNKTGRIEKYECLVRIIDEGGKVLSPFSFLQVAKEARLYGEITRRMIGRGIAAFKDKDYEFSINISVEDIHDSAVEEFMTKILKNNPEIARRTTFEIIESEGIENYEIVYAFIQKVKEYGCKIAIDDFGAGYSNFGHTMQLNIDYLKIDSTLIKEIDKNERLQILTDTIVNYAKRLGIKTIAEYVHSKEVHEKVITLGVDYSQGYYIGEPKPTIEGCG